ncbi:MAG: MBL fold metallo-hydrolase [Clostridia bacterium]|jgi:glyoxylase-like metal-dependent hydrolase (beta-lactamase superfamily II)
MNNIKVTLIKRKYKSPITNLIVNTVLLSNNNKAVLFDPSIPVSELEKHLGDKQLLAVVLTHAHWDHILNLEEVLNKYDVPLYLHKNASKLFNDSTLNCSTMHKIDLNFNIPEKTKVIELDENYCQLNLGEFKLDSYYTPGHSDDSITYLIEDNIICGDSIRLNKPARTDLPTSNTDDLEKSNEFFKGLNPEFTVYNGHEAPDKLKNFYLFKNFEQELN